jgi:hypothetical protein
MWWFVPLFENPAVSFIFIIPLAAALPPLIFLVMALITFVLWINYQLTIGLLISVFRERFTSTLGSLSGPRRRQSLIVDFVLRFGLVCVLAAPLLWDPLLLFGYVFSPILGCVLAAALAEFLALLIYAWRTRHITSQMDALLKS